MKLEKQKKQVKNRKRKGRGISAGCGKTAGRGTKGQKARSGGGVRPAFEGGQMPLTKRVPKKRGFKSTKPKPHTVTLEMLNKFKDGSTITEEFLRDRDIISSAGAAKIVDKGELSRKLIVKVPVSKGAASKIEKMGGRVER